MTTSTTAVLFTNIYNAPSVNGIELFCTLTETHIYESKSTMYPVQSGSTIIDNVIQAPVSIRMKVLISDTPIKTTNTQNRNSAENSESTQNVPLQNLNSDTTYSISTMESLVKLHQDRIATTLVTGIKIYQNMVLTKIDIPRNERTGRGLIIELEFSQIMLSNVSIGAQNSLNPKNFNTNAISTNSPVIFEENDAVKAENTIESNSNSVEQTSTNQIINQFSPKEALGALATQAVSSLKSEVVNFGVRTINKLTGLFGF